MEFGDFFEAERNRLIRLCWLLTLDREAAADVAQEAMARAWESWDLLSRPGSNPTGWVRVVAINLSRSRWRRLQRVTRHAASSRAENESALAADPDLHAAIRALSTRQREAIVLRYWADLRLDDCAETMGISTGAVKQHLARAHDRLATSVGPNALEELRL